MSKNYKNKAEKILKSRLGGNIDKSKIKIINNFGNIIVISYRGTIWALDKDMLKM